MEKLFPLLPVLLASCSQKKDVDFFFSPPGAVRGYFFFLCPETDPPLFFLSSLALCAKNEFWRWTEGKGDRRDNTWKADPGGRKVESCEKRTRREVERSPCSLDSYKWKEERGRVEKQKCYFRYLTQEDRGRWAG